MDKYLAYEIKELERTKHKPILTSILNANGDIVATSNRNAALAGVPTEQLIGLNAKFATIDQIKKLMPALPSEELIIVQENFLALSQLVDTVIQEQIEVSYINFMPYGGINQPYIETMIPIFGETLQVVGIKIIFTEFSLYGHNEYFLELSKLIKAQHGQTKKIYPIINDQTAFLASRQQEILYLLANGFSQTDVAQILHISRGAIANIVSEQLCPKFNIAGSSTKLLVEKAVSLGLDKIMPAGLYKPFIIVMNKDLAKQRCK